MAKVLFADDSLSVRLVASRLLTSAGYTVSLAADADEAIERFAADRPDLVIADINMPDKNGFAVCEHVRNQEGAADMPVVLISSLINEDTKRQAEKCRATIVIKKPFSWQGLITQIEALLASKQSSGSVSEPGEDVVSPPVHADGPLQRQGLTEVEARLEAEQQRCRRLDEQATDLRNTLVKATESISMLEARLARSEERCGQLTQTIRDIEHAAAWAQRLAKFLSDLSESTPRERETMVSSRNEVP